MRLSISIILLTLFVVLGAAVFFAFTAHQRSHEFVSADGGFVTKSGFKHPVEQVERSFERYRFLRGTPNMPLYRTTKLNLSEVFSRAAKFEYKPNIEKNPVNWWLELQNKCIEEYIPNLPTALEREDLRLFFFNQYGNTTIKIHGYSQGKIFALKISNNLKKTASGNVQESPVWCYTKEIDIQQDNWRDIWQFVNENKETLITQWQRDQKQLTEEFDPAYNGLFQ